MKKLGLAQICFLLTVCCLIPVTLSAGFSDFGFKFDFGGNGQTFGYVDLISNLAATPSSVAFGNISTGSTRTQNITWSNSGTAESEEITQTVTGTGFSLSSVGTCGANPFNIASGGSCYSTVQFLPASSGAVTGALTATWPNRDPVVASLTGVGVQTDPYTTYFASDWAGTGTQDTSNPAGGVYSGWTTVSDTATLLANTSNALVATYGGVTTAAYVAKTGLTVHTDIRAQFDFKLSTLTIGKTADPQILVLRNATNSMACIYTATTNASTQNRLTLVWYNGAGNPTTVNVAYAFVADTTYTITLRHKSSTDTSTADGNYYVDINGENVIAVTNVTTLQNPSIIRMGMVYTDGAITGALTYDNFTLGYK